MRGTSVIAGTAALLLAAVGGYAAAPAKQAIPAYITAAVANPERPEADRMRDADRRPAEVIAFAGLKPGMSVVELAPGGGYFTRILSGVVGSSGKVITISSRPTPAVEAWANTHGNITMIDTAPPGTIPIQNTDRADIVWTTLNY